MNLDAVDEDAALVGVVEPLDEREHGGLPGSGRADERGHAARRHGEAHSIVDFRQLGPVPELHRVEDDRRRCGGYAQELSS